MQYQHLESLMELAYLKLSLKFIVIFWKIISNMHLKSLSHKHQSPLGEGPVSTLQAPGKSFGNVVLRKNGLAVGNTGVKSNCMEGASQGLGT